MGEIAKRLHRKLASKSHHLPTKAPRRRPGDPLPGGVKNISTLINESCVPLHAVFAFISPQLAWRQTVTVRSKLLAPRLPREPHSRPTHGN